MREALGAIIVLLAACTHSTGPIPPLHIPQLEQAQQEVSGGIGKRYQDYGACRKTSTTTAMLVSCMDTAGYGYLPRSAEAQAMECWRLRDQNVTDPLPEALCFQKATP
jgi:hypothetical protein